MERRPKVSRSPDPTLDDDIYDATPEPSNQRRVARAGPNNTSLSPSPATSVSSDKENRSSQSRTIDKGKGRMAMPPPRLSAPLSDTDPAAGKRKRTTDRDAVQTQSRRQRTAEPEEDDEDPETSYDPDQDVEERRRLRKEFRNLHSRLNDNRTEYMNPASTGLYDTLQKANELSAGVKQTGDATIDSRLLVTTADLSYKKTVQLTLGDSVQGVDIDEFVSKCITFMRRGDSPAQDNTQLPNSTQRRRRRQQAGEDSDEEGDEGDENNWGHLGRQVCLLYNARPSVPGFLLGPLSLEKRARKATQRKQGLKISSLKQTQPEVMTAADIEKNENTNLTVLCQRILGRLNKVTRDGVEAVEAEAPDDATREEVLTLMDKYGVHESGGVDLFRFVVNPYSFGQTVENLFYVSFLIRDGKAGINIGENGLPSLGQYILIYKDFLLANSLTVIIEATVPRSGQGNAKKGVSKHQAVLALDMAQWKELVEVFGITEPMIPHREEVVQEIGAKGWYN
jgi:hypothetical protein